MSVYSSLYRLIALDLLRENLCENVGGLLMIYFGCLSVAKLRQTNTTNE